MSVELNIETIQNFWLHMQQIQAIVLLKMKLPTFQLPLSVSGAPILGEPVPNKNKIEWLLEFCDLLMKKSTGVQEFAKIVKAAKLDTSAKFDDDSQTLIDRADEVFMEHLTAIWLALYFYGVPFCHPWEMVRRMSEDKGGLPSGACLIKAMGDVYRTERQSLCRSERHLVEGQVNAVQVLVLTRFPSVIHPDSLSRKLDKYTPLSAHVLGRCYAFLQLRLYIDRKLPIRYLVPENTLKESWAFINSSSTTPNTATSEIKAWLTQINIDPAKNQKIELLEDIALSRGVPTCILGRKNGVLTLGTTPGNSLSGGNLLFKGLLDSYRTRLNTIPESRSDQLITVNNLPRMLAKL